MASTPNSRKRKAPAPISAPKGEAFSSAGALEMLSEDEKDEEPESDDGDYEEFPEIDTASDTENEGNDYEEESDEDEEEDSFSSSSGSDEKLPIFPKAKVVISDITGEPKKVYPEIDPNYDSDSSTEEVSTSTASLLATPL
jgi:ribosome biogenesis protein ERB1